MSRNKKRKTPVIVHGWALHNAHIDVTEEALGIQGMIARVEQLDAEEDTDEG